MKLWLTTIENKCFMKHLLGEYVKIIILLVCSICTVHRLFYFYFFPVIDLCSFFYSIFALFIWRFSPFIYSSILVSHFVFLFFSLLFVLFFPFYIYHCTSSVFALCVHYSYNSALVSWVLFFFFVYSTSTIFTATKVCLFVFAFSFSFKYWCKLTFILLYWHKKFHNIFTIIDVSISYKSK